MTNQNQTTGELLAKTERRARELINEGGDATYLVWPLVDRLRWVQMAAQNVINDYAQDLLEDPSGSFDREKTGFARISVAALKKLQRALVGGDPHLGAETYGKPE